MLCTHSDLCWLPQQRLNAFRDSTRTSRRRTAGNFSAHHLKRPSSIKELARNKAVGLLPCAMGSLAVLPARQGGMLTVKVKTAFIVLHSWHLAVVEVTILSSQLCQVSATKVAHRGPGSTPVWQPVRTRPAGRGNRISDIVTKTSTETALGPNSPQVHCFNTTDFLGTQGKTISS